MYGHPRIERPRAPASERAAARAGVAMFLPAGYTVRPALLHRRWRAQCAYWIGGLCDSRAAAVADAWRHRLLL